MKYLIVLVNLLLISVGANAADAKRFQNLGFSTDGKYYAFVQSAIGDGSGYAYAQGFVIEVATNKLVKSADVTIEIEYSKESEAIKQVLAKLDLPSYRIDRKNPGRTLWIRMPTDISAPALNAHFSTHYAVDGGASSLWPKFILQLVESVPPVPEDCDGEARMITLTLVQNFENHNGAVELQKDSRLPKSRYCAHGYQIRQVIQNGDALVVVLRYDRPGFEGPDYNHMAITNGVALKTGGLK